MILQISNYRYPSHPVEHELNMAFWRAVRATLGPLHVVGRAPVRVVETSRQEDIVFTLFPQLRGSFRFLSALRLWLQSQSAPDVVWCSDPVVSPLVALPYARRRLVPCIVELQGNFFSAGDPAISLVARWLAIRAARNADMVRVCSERHSKTLIKLGLSGERIVTIKARVDTDMFSPGRYNRQLARERLGLQTDDVAVIGVGNLVPGKGFRYAVEAVAKLAPNVKLLLVGDGPERVALTRLAAKLAASRKVRFLGRIRHQNMPEILSAGDIFVLPSFAEGMPRAIAEAMAIGLPVVATDIDGINEQVINGVTGLLYGPPGNSDGLASALRDLAFSKKKRAAMSCAARSHAVASYDFKSVMQRWISAIDVLKYDERYSCKSASGTGN